MAESISSALSDSSADDNEGSRYRPIGEVATLLRLQPHVLRFWETKFKQISPLKRSGGRRYYRREDVRLLFAIRDLLYVEGYTLRGAQKALRARARGGEEQSKLSPSVNLSVNPSVNLSVNNPSVNNPSVNLSVNPSVNNASTSANASTGAGMNAGTSDLALSSAARAQLETLAQRLERTLEQVSQAEPQQPAPNNDSGATAESYTNNRISSGEQ